MFATSMDGRPGSVRGWPSWVAWLDCEQGDFTNIMYKVVLELAIVKNKNLRSVVLS